MAKKTDPTSKAGAQPKSKTGAGAGFDYGAKAAELESIVAQLQDPDIQIDAATRLHAEGLKLIGELESYLNQAEIEVNKRVA